MLTNWIISYIIFITTYSISSGYCLYLDLYTNIDKRFVKQNKSEIIYQYKFIIPRILLNAFGLIPVFFYYTDKIIIYKSSFSYLDFGIQIMTALLLIDIFFYITHWIMHHPSIFMWSHKIHHRFKKPVGMEAIYHHWFDLYFSNLLPIFLSLWVLPSKSVYTWYFWVFMATAVTVLHSHSGWSKSGHNDHHKYSIYHYGVGVFMDHLLGTEKV